MAFIQPPRHIHSSGKVLLLQDENLVLLHDINDTDGLRRFEDRRVETVEKMEVVTVLASKSQGQVNVQGQRMVDQNLNDLIQFRETHFLFDALASIPEAKAIKNEDERVEQEVIVLCNDVDEQSAKVLEQAKI